MNIFSIINKFCNCGNERRSYLYNLIFLSFHKSSFSGCEPKKQLSGKLDIIKNTNTKKSINSLLSFTKITIKDQKSLY